MAGEVVKPVLFNCPACGAALEISALGSIASIVCKSCKSVLDAHHPLYKKIGDFTEATKEYKPFFDLGNFGILRGTKWKIIGFVVRRDSSAEFEWEEYLLYNPYFGFKWLLRIENHFSVTSRLYSQPVQNLKNQIVVDNNPYRLFSAAEVNVQYVVGEFYWRVSVGEKVTMKDYISPPYMISKEESFGAEVSWSVSEYVSNKEVLKAFKTDEFFFGGGPKGVAANQPNPYAGYKKMFWSALIAVLVLGLISISSSVLRSARVVKVESVSKSVSPYVSSSFEVPGKIGMLEFILSSPVNNEWVEAGVTLVNENTGEDFSFTQGVEFYQGRDSDGNWTEGSRTNGNMISSVPGGTYHLEVEVDGSQVSPNAEIKLIRNSKMTTNFVVAILLLLFPAIWMFLRAQSFEAVRWANSDYNPNGTKEESEE